MPVPGSPFRQDFPAEIIERGKKGDRAVPVIVVGASANLPLLQGQPRLRALQRLALAFLIAAQHDRPHGRIQFIRHKNDRLPL
jgi:hypothetical protein